MQSWRPREKSRQQVSRYHPRVSVRFGDPSSIKWVLSGRLGKREGKRFEGARSESTFDRYFSYGWPVRTVERLPPYCPKKFKYPVLVIGNTVREFSVRGLFLSDHWKY